MINGHFIEGCMLEIYLYLFFLNIGLGSFKFCKVKLYSHAQVWFFHFLHSRQIRESAETELNLKLNQRPESK